MWKILKAVFAVFGICWHWIDGLLSKLEHADYLETHFPGAVDVMEESRALLAVPEWLAIAIGPAVGITFLVWLFWPDIKRRFRFAHAEELWMAAKNVISAPGNIGIVTQGQRGNNIINQAPATREITDEQRRLFVGMAALPHGITYQVPVRLNDGSNEGRAFLRKLLELINSARGWNAQSQGEMVNTLQHFDGLRIAVGDPSNPPPAVVKLQGALAAAGIECRIVGGPQNWRAENWRLEIGAQQVPELAAVQTANKQDDKPAIQQNIGSGSIGTINQQGNNYVTNQAPRARHLTSQTAAALASALSGHQIQIMVEWPSTDPEATRFAQEIAAAIHQANVGGVGIRASQAFGGSPIYGVVVKFTDSPSGQLLRNALALAQIQYREVGKISGPSAPGEHIYIGHSQP